MLNYQDCNLNSDDHRKSPVVIGQKQGIGTSLIAFVTEGCGFDQHDVFTETYQSDQEEVAQKLLNAVSNKYKITLNQTYRSFDGFEGESQST